MAGKLNIKTISDAAVKFKFSVENENWLNGNIPAKQIPSALSQRIDLIKSKYPYKISEAAICETIISPILQEVWTNYYNDLTIWSHKTLKFNNEIIGIPDYIITKYSHLGAVVFGPPLMTVIEAKKDDFEWGWGQCASEMYVIQQMNKNPNLPVYGMVSNGDSWEFGILEKNKIIVNKERYHIDQINQLYSVVHHIFNLCNQNALKIKNN